MYCRTNLTMRQLAPLFGISSAAVGRIIDRHGPLLALAPARRKPGRREVVIVDGTLVPTRDRSVVASSKNYRYSVNLQVLIKAETRLVPAVGRPLPGNRNDCTAFAESGIEETSGRAPPCSPTAAIREPAPSSRIAAEPDRTAYRSGRNSTTPPTGKSGLASSTSSPG